MKESCQRIIPENETSQVPSQEDPPRIVEFPQSEETSLRLKLREKEEELQSADPNGSDGWIVIGEIGQAIISNPAMLRAANCSSERQYYDQCFERLGIPGLTIKKNVNRYRVYRNLEEYFRYENLDIGFNREALVEKRLASKLDLLELAVNVKHRRIDGNCTMGEVFEHFLNDSLKEFKEFIDSDMSRKERSSEVLKRKKAILKVYSREYRRVHLISYVPSEELDKKHFEKIISDALYGGFDADS